MPEPPGPALPAHVARGRDAALPQPGRPGGVAAAALRVRALQAVRGGPQPSPVYDLRWTAVS